MSSSNPPAWYPLDSQPPLEPPSESTLQLPPAPLEVPSPPTPTPIWPIDPNGDTLVTVHNIPASLPKDLNDLSAYFLSGPWLKNAVFDEGERVILRVSSKVLVMTCKNYKRLCETAPRQAFGAETEMALQLRTSNDHDHDHDHDAEPALNLTVSHPNGVSFILLMLILHTRTTRIPSSLSAKMLIDISTLVHTYGCRDSVQFYGDTWLAETWFEIQVDHAGADKTLGEWMGLVFVTWVFGHGIGFKRASGEVVRRSEGVISSEDYGLDVPEAVIDKMNKTRIESLTTILHTITTIHTALLNTCLSSVLKPTSPNSQALTEALGCLTKHMADLGILDTPDSGPAPQPPYTGLSIKAVLGKWGEFYAGLDTSGVVAGEMGDLDFDFGVDGPGGEGEGLDVYEFFDLGEAFGGR